MGGTVQNTKRHKGRGLGVEYVTCAVAMVVLIWTFPVLAQAPTIRVENVKSNQVDVVWTANPKAGTTFLVQKRLGDGESGEWITALTVNEHRPDPPSDYRRTIEDLKPNTEHCFRVRQGTIQNGISQLQCTVTGGNQASAIQLAVRIGPFSQQGTSPCTGRVTWRFTPRTLTGGSGNGSSFSVNRDYKVEPTKTGQEWFCVVRDNGDCPKFRV
jgi:hypothetical protein